MRGSRTWSENALSSRSFMVRLPHLRSRIDGLPSPEQRSTLAQHPHTSPKRMKWMAYKPIAGPPTAASPARFNPSPAVDP